MPVWSDWLGRFRHWVDAPVEVPLAVEIAPEYVAGIRHRHGRVEAWAVTPLPGGAVRASPLADNLGDAGAVREAVERVVGTVGNGQLRCALILPDLIARVFFLDFDQIPRHRQEADELIRWRLSKDLPFDSRQAVLSYHAQPARDSGQEVLVAVCAPEVLLHYEEQVAALGLHPGEVTLSTLAALGWLPTGDATPRLLVKSEPGSLGLAILRDRAVRLFRSVPLPTSGATTEEGLFEKIYPAVVHFQDHWGEAVAETLVAGMSPLNAALARQLYRETGTVVTELNPVKFELPPSPTSSATPDARLAACMGWVRGENP